MDRPLLPPSFRRRAFDALHALSQFGGKGLPPPAVIEVLVAGDEQGRRHLGLELCGLSEDEGGETRAPAGPTHRRAFTTFFTRPRRFSGSSTLYRRLHTRVHGSGPFNSLAGRLSHQGDLHAGLHRLPRAVDLWFRRPCNSDFGPWLSIHFFSLVFLL